MAGKNRVSNIWKLDLKEETTEVAMSKREPRLQLVGKEQKKRRGDLCGNVSHSKEANMIVPFDLESSITFTKYDTCVIVWHIVLVSRSEII